MAPVNTPHPEQAQGRTPGPEITGDWEPEAERLVSDPETLKALSDPLRLRILETMVARVDEPWSAKELAVRLDVPQTRLYHHIELLLERDLIRAAEQRIISGIIETRYRVAAMSLRLDRRLLSSDSSIHDAARELLHTVFDTSRDEIARALNAPGGSMAGAEGEGSLALDPPLLTRGLARLTPARAGEFRERLEALIREFESEDESATTEMWSLLVAFYRQEAATREASRD
jgi:DNA-binding transcriptional ArsR family regulator